MRIFVVSDSRRRARNWRTMLSKRFGGRTPQIICCASLQQWHEHDKLLGDIGLIDAKLLLSDVGAEPSNLPPGSACVYERDGDAKHLQERGFNPEKLQDVIVELVGPTGRARSREGSHIPPSSKNKKPPTPCLYKGQNLA